MRTWHLSPSCCRFDCRETGQSGDKAGALALLERALELDPDLQLKPQEQVDRWANSTEQFERCAIND